MNSVFELPQNCYQRVGPRLGSWKIGRSALPDSLVSQFGGFRELIIDVTVDAINGPQAFRQGDPFEISLVIAKREGDIKETIVFWARRTLGLLHLWTREQITKDGIRIVLEDTLMPDSYKGFCDKLFRGLVQSVLEKTPKAIIRWDQQGVVVCVNIANTYVSTREHFISI